MNRRNFFKIFGAGVGVGVINTISAQAQESISIEPKIKDIPFKNPIIKCSFTDYYDHPHSVKLDFEKKIIYPLEINTFQNLYSYMKERWFMDPDSMKHSFPFVAITPEQFEVVGGWKVENLHNIVGGGFSQFNENGEREKDYASIILLSQEGLVFNEDMASIQNGGLVELKNNKFLGYYQHSPLSGIISLDEHLTHFKEQTIFEEFRNNISPQCYRII